MESLDATLTLAGTASDDRVVSRVTWVNDRGGSGVAHQDAAAANVNWDAANIALADGSNNIVVTDSAGARSVRCSRQRRCGRHSRWRVAVRRSRR